MQMADVPELTRRACDSCYKRKIKCDTAVPQCRWCNDHDIPCTYNRVQRKRKARVSGQQHKLTELSQRVARLETLLVDHFKRNASSIPPRISQNPYSLSFVDNSLGNIARDQTDLSYLMRTWLRDRETCSIMLPTVIPDLLPGIRKWVRACTGRAVSSDKLSPTSASRQHEQDQESSPVLASPPKQILELPDWWVVRLYFDAYRKSPMMRIFPIVEVELFQETIKAVYWPQQSGLRNAHASSRTCILAFLSFAARLPPVAIHLSVTPFPTVEHGTMASKSQTLLTQVLGEPASLDIAQTATILTLYELLSGCLEAAHHLLSIATRQLMILGANIAPDRVSSSGERGEKKREQLRNLFWICYTVDKDISLHTGRPPIIADENSDLTLPHGYLDRALYDPEKDANPYDGPVFPFDLRLSLIKSKVYSKLYSAKALGKSDADLLKTIRELDDSLEEWRLSVFPDRRPPMSSKAETFDYDVSIRSVMLHLNYCLCIIAIHQASIQCKASAKGHTMEGGLTSSLALSVEVSRSTLAYLKRAERILVGWAFWGLVFYAMAALLTVFCNILQDPLNSLSRDDARLLKVAAGLMERILSSGITSEKEASNVKVVANFVAELSWLAESAIRKARHESDTDLTPGQ